MRSLQAITLNPCGPVPCLCRAAWAQGDAPGSSRTGPGPSTATSAPSTAPLQADTPPPPRVSQEVWALGSLAVHRGAGGRAGLPGAPILEDRGARPGSCAVRRVGVQGASVGGRPEGGLVYSGGRGGGRREDGGERGSLFVNSLRAGGCDGEVPAGQRRQGVSLRPASWGRRGLAGGLPRREDRGGGARSAVHAGARVPAPPDPEPKAWDRVGGDGGGPPARRRERPGARPGGGSGPDGDGAGPGSPQPGEPRGPRAPSPHAARPPPPPPLLSPAHDPPFCSIHAPLRPPPPQRAPRPGRRRCRRRRRCACALGPVATLAA